MQNLGYSLLETIELYATLVPWMFIISNRLSYIYHMHGVRTVVEKNLVLGILVPVVNNHLCMMVSTTFIFCILYNNV